MPERLALMALLAILPTLAHADPSAERQATLLHRLKHDCGACHGMTLRGGLGPPLGAADLAGLSDEAMIDTILRGRPGTPMPPWAFEIAPAEAAWLVERLREGLGDAG